MLCWTGWQDYLALRHKWKEMSASFLSISQKIYAGPSNFIYEQDRPAVEVLLKD